MNTIAIRRLALGFGLLLQSLSPSVVFGQTSPTVGTPVGVPAAVPEIRMLSQPAVAFGLSTARQTPVIASRASRGSARESLADSIARATRRSLIDLGTETAKEAVLDCLKGDYPGGGMGLLSLPFGRASAHTDHCIQ